MTLGEKLKELRKRFEMSQDDLGDRLNVSRQTITKWETDVAIPDTNNIVEISKLYGVTVDSLLDNKFGLPSLLHMIEYIDLDNYDKGQYKDKYVAILKTKFKDFDIYPLMRTRKMNKLEWLFDFFVGAGTVDVVDGLSDLSRYFLAKKVDVQLIVNIKKDRVIATELLNHSGKKIKLDNNIFTIINTKL